MKTIFSLQTSLLVEAKKNKKSFKKASSTQATHSTSFIQTCLAFASLQIGAQWSFSLYIVSEGRAYDPSSSYVQRRRVFPALFSLCLHQFPTSSSSSPSHYVPCRLARCNFHEKLSTIFFVVIVFVPALISGLSDTWKSFECAREHRRRWWNTLYTSSSLSRLLPTREMCEECYFSLWWWREWCVCVHERIEKSAEEREGEEEEEGEKLRVVEWSRKWPSSQKQWA